MQPRMLRSVQESPQKAQKQAWERQPGETAAEYLRFLRYLHMGRGRSLQAVSMQEREARSGRKNENVSEPTEERKPDVVKISIPGSLSRLSGRWKWHERAEAYDIWLRWENHKRLLTFLDHEASYLTRAARLNALDTLMVGLMTDTQSLPKLSGWMAMNDEGQMKTYLAMHKQMLATLREIRREMAAIDKMDIRTLSEMAERLI